MCICIWSHCQNLQRSCFWYHGEDLKLCHTWSDSQVSIDSFLLSLPGSSSVSFLGSSTAAPKTLWMAGMFTRNVGILLGLSGFLLGRDSIAALRPLPDMLASTGGSTYSTISFSFPPKNKIGEKIDKRQTETVPVRYTLWSPVKLPLRQYCISLNLATQLLDSISETLGLENLGRFCFLGVDMFLKQ